MSLISMRRLCRRGDIGVPRHSCPCPSASALLSQLNPTYQAVKVAGCSSVALSSSGLTERGFYGPLMRSRVGGVKVSPSARLHTSSALRPGNCPQLACCCLDGQTPSPLRLDYDPGILTAPGPLAGPAALSMEEAGCWLFSRRIRTRELAALPPIPRSAAHDCPQGSGQRD